MKTVALSDIVKKTSKDAEIARLDVKIILDEFLYEVLKEIGRGNKVDLRGFGRFEVREPTLDSTRTEPYKRKPTRYVDFKLAATAKKRLRDAGWIIPRDA